MKALVSRLRKLDIATLRNLAGETIVRAVEEVRPTNSELALAEVLAMKYGQNVLQSKEMRLALIDVLAPGEALDLCRLTGQENLRNALPYSLLARRYERLNAAKSKELADFFGFGESFYYHPVTETRESNFKISVAKGESVALKPYLHFYQKRMKDEILDMMLGGAERFLMQMPTGAGKTYTALEAVVDLLRRPRMEKFVVWLVDSNELAEQALESFAYLWKLKGDKELHTYRLFGAFDQDFRLHRGGVVFAGFAKFYSILSNPQSPHYSSLWHLINQTDLLVVDEAHTSVADTYSECIRAFINSDVTILGLTATPGRTDAESTQELVALYNANLVRMRDENGAEIDNPIAFLQEHEYLANLQTEILETEIRVEESNEDRILASLAANPTRNVRIIEQIELADSAQESALVFACTLDHVFALTIMCRSRNIPCDFIVGATSQAERIKILERFRRSEFRVLINLDILSTGVDLPNVNKIVITRPIGSPIMYSQIIGRALRGPKNGGNPKNTIVNIQDNLLNYPSANLLYTRFREDWDSRTIRR